MNPVYKPIRDDPLSQLFGVKVNVYDRGPGHMDRGYSDPWSAGDNSVSLSVPAYQNVKNLQLLASGSVPNLKLAPKLDVGMARAAFVLAHELGHLRSPVHDNEDMANNYAWGHVKGVMQTLGVPKPLRLRLYRMLNAQGLG